MPVERISRSQYRPVPAGSSSSRTTSKSNGVKSSSKANRTPRVYTDTILTIKPEYARLIDKREKNHEFRNYELRSTVKRLWLYESAPISAIRYVAETSRPKTPGEIQDPSGVGNDDFDRGLMDSKFAYPVIALYKLKEPIALNEMKKQYNLTAPQGYCYAPAKLTLERKLEDMARVF